MYDYFMCKFCAVFSAARTTSYVTSAAQLPFNVILVDTENGFDFSKAYYTVKQAGYYMFHFSAGVPAFQRLNMALRNASSTPNIILTHTTFDDVVVTSRDDIQYVNEGQRLYISSDYPLMSDGMMQTSWSGLRLDGLYSPLILFRAACTTTLQTIGDVTLDKMLINVGGGWDACNSRFVAPRDGIYFFSWSSASVTNTIHVVNLYLNNSATLLIQLAISGGYYNGSDTATQSALLQLRAGDFVTLRSNMGSLYSDVNYQTSFLGFLYEPIAGNKAAWTLGFIGQAYGPTTIPFNSLLLLEGITWNSSTRQLTILTSGAYYLKLSGVSYPLEYRFRMGVIVNSQPEPLMSVMDEITSPIRTQFYTVRTRALITRLQQGDTLEVGVPLGYEAGPIENEVVFAGFRV
jgi:hypothetical protein